MSEPFDAPVLHLGRAELAAVRFRAVDAIDAAASKLTGKAIRQGQQLLILVTCDVALSETGVLRIDSMTGRAKIRDIEAETTPR